MIKWVKHKSSQYPKNGKLVVADLEKEVKMGCTVLLPVHTMEKTIYAGLVTLGLSK